MDYLLFPIVYMGHGIRPFTDPLLHLIPEKVWLPFVGLLIYLVATGILAIGLFVWAFIHFGWIVLPYLLGYLVLSYPLRHR